MDNKKLNEILGQLQKNAVKIKTNEDYVQGKNPYILNKELGKKPDNRIPVALAKMTVENMSGYAGRAGDRKAKYEKVSKEADKEDDPFIDYTRVMDAHNEEEIETSELYDESLTQGVSYEIWWTSDDLNLPNGVLTAEYKIVPTGSVYIEWTSDIKPTMEYFVYFSGDEEERTASVYYPLYKDVYTSKNGAGWSFVEKVDYVFKTPPIAIFKSNRNAMPIFEAEKPLIDTFDETISKSFNEIDRNNAALLLMGKKLSPEFLSDLEAGRISAIDDMDNDERTDLPKYMEKNFTGFTQFYNEFLDRIKRLYQESTNVVDMSDENFAGQASGVAMAYKLLGMEFKASQIDTYFNRGMKRRLELYADVYNAGVGTSVNLMDYKATISMNRNVPVDVETRVKIAGLLRGLISLPTIIEGLPKEVVKDVEKEIALLEATQELIIEEEDEQENEA